MSKNRYRMPCNGTWYVEYGGYTKKTSHSWEIPSQRYAYDLEIRKNNLPYHDEPDKIENYYSYLEEICAPLDGFVITIVNEYKNTHITKDRKVINDSKDPKGNYIVIKHQNGEYSTICHFEKDSFVVKEGDLVKEGDMLGRVGNSGNTQGPHIHFQVQRGPDPTHDQGIPIFFKDTYSNGRKHKKIERGIEVERRSHE